MEYVMKVICRDVDSFVPAGGSSHQAILDQVAAPRKGIRPELIGEDWYPAVNELRAFRHVVNHNYANELREELVTANLARMQEVFPKFLDSLQELDSLLSSPSSSVPDPFEKQP